MTECDVLPMAVLVGRLSVDDRLPSRGPAQEMAASSDSVLMGRVARGDTEAFAVLYRRYERPLFGFLFRLAGARPLAEDLLQETFTRVWLAAASYDPGRGALRPWLYRVALNLARSELARKAYRVRHVSLETGVSLPSEGEGDVAEQIDAATRARAVAEAVAALPDFMREVVVLRCYQQLSLAEIAEITGAPVGTLKSRFHRAVTALRTRLGESEGRHEA